MEHEIKYNSIVSKLVQPIRIIGFIPLLLLLFKADTSWDPSLMFFSYFIPLYVASFGSEIILTSPPKGLRKGFRSLSIKFAQMLPVEFAGVASFALLTFAPNTINKLLLSIEVSLVVMTCWIGLELYYTYVVPHLNRIKITPQIGTLAAVGMTIVTFFEAFYFLVLSANHPIFIQ